MIRRLWWLPLLALSLLLGWWLGGRLQSPLPAQRLVADPACDLGRQACSLALPGGGRVTLALAPLPPRVMQPMQLTVTLDGPARSVWVDFVGINMDMGVNRAELVPVPGGLWKGQVILPICSAAQMQWEARVSVLREGRIEAPFGFTTHP